MHCCAMFYVRMLDGILLTSLAVQVGKIDLDTRAFGKNFVPVHLAALVVSHGLALRCRLAVEHR